MAMLLSQNFTGDGDYIILELCSTSRLVVHNNHELPLMIGQKLLKFLLPSLVVKAAFSYLCIFSSKLLKNSSRSFILEMFNLTKKKLLEIP